MAFDDWIASRASEAEGAVMLRLYTWNQPAITFGYHQHADRAFDHVNLGDTPAIRRITGGRALLHDPSELTYAIGISLAGGAFGDHFATISSASERISETLVTFLRASGRDSQYLRVSSVENSRPNIFHSAPCFASSAKYEVFSDGRKLIASAQKRLSGGLFQHGSIKIGGLAKHPALDGPGDAIECKPVTLEQFTGFTRLFFQTFSSSLSMEITTAPDFNSGGEWVMNRERMIQEDSLAKREIVKQEESEISL